jgi:hypothetical protein
MLPVHDSREITQVSEINSDFSSLRPDAPNFIPRAATVAVAVLSDRTSDLILNEIGIFLFSPCGFSKEKSYEYSQKMENSDNIATLKKLKLKFQKGSLHQLIGSFMNHHETEVLLGHLSQL